MVNAAAEKMRSPNLDEAAPKISSLSCGGFHMWPIMVQVSGQPEVLVGPGRQAGWPGGGEGDGPVMSRPSPPHLAHGSRQHGNKCPLAAAIDRRHPGGPMLPLAEGRARGDQPALLLFISAASLPACWPGAHAGSPAPTSLPYPHTPYRFDREPPALTVPRPPGFVSTSPPCPPLSLLSLSAKQKDTTQCLKSPIWG